MILKWSRCPSIRFFMLIDKTSDTHFSISTLDFASTALGMNPNAKILAGFGFALRRVVISSFIPSISFVILSILCLVSTNSLTKEASEGNGGCIPPVIVPGCQTANCRSVLDAPPLGRQLQVYLAPRSRVFPL